MKTTLSLLKEILSKVAESGLLKSKVELKLLDEMEDAIASFPEKFERNYSLILGTNHDLHFYIELMDRTTISIIVYEEGYNSFRHVFNNEKILESKGDVLIKLNELESYIGKDYYKVECSISNEIA